MVPTTIPNAFPIDTQSPLVKPHQLNKEDRSRAQHPEWSFEDYEKGVNADFMGEMTLNPIERDEDGFMRSDDQLYLWREPGGENRYLQNDPIISIHYSDLRKSNIVKSAIEFLEFKRPELKEIVPPLIRPMHYSLLYCASKISIQTVMPEGLTVRETDEIDSDQYNVNLVQSHLEMERVRRLGENGTALTLRQRWNLLKRKVTSTWLVRNPDPQNPNSSESQRSNFECTSECSSFEI
jgi:hypothetical protein